MRCERSGGLRDVRATPLGATGLQADAQFLGAVQRSEELLVRRTPREQVHDAQAEPEAVRLEALGAGELNARE